MVSEYNIAVKEGLQNASVVQDSGRLTLMELPNQV